MKVTEKLELISRIGRELQARFTYDEIDVFLAEFGIERPAIQSSNSKWVYAKAALAGHDDALILRVAEELELVSPGAAGPLHPPRNWASGKEFRLFLSHLSKDKDKATRLKTCLAPRGISGFVAHEDIHPTLEWQNEIERALHTMDAFVAILTPGFKDSVWTQQEIGYALGRGVKIIALRMGEDPAGFISRQQALSRGSRTAEAVAEEIADLLLDDARTRDRLAAVRQARAGLPDDIPF